MPTEPKAEANNEADYITVSPFIRYMNHALAGITEAPRIAVRVNPKTMDVEYEPTKLWLKNTATVALFGATAWAIWYRRRRLEAVNGLLSLAGASRPVLAGLAWTTGIAGALNLRRVKPDSLDD
ncbi:hypothetical protein EC988_000749 [Linderina pennispora]|nr:hypothetical protein EC988_000749 [Linderina pennispora]